MKPVPMQLQGGVTTVVAMPNTTPVIDSHDRANYVKNKAAQVSAIHVLQAGAMTKENLGRSFLILQAWQQQEYLFFPKMVNLL